MLGRCRKGVWLFEAYSNNEILEFLQNMRSKLSIDYSDREFLFNELSFSYGWKLKSIFGKFAIDLLLA